MSSERLQNRLAEVETLLGEMASLLVLGDAPAFEATATALRQSMAELASASATEPPISFLDADLQQRLQKIAQALARQRDNLARRAAATERGLAAVLPQHSVTYKAPGRSGMFGGSAARIYGASAG